MISTSPLAEELTVKSDIACSSESSRKVRLRFPLRGVARRGVALELAALPPGLVTGVICNLKVKKSFKYLFL